MARQENEFARLDDNDDNDERRTPTPAPAATAPPNDEMAAMRAELDQLRGEVRRLRSVARDPERTAQVGDVEEIVDERLGELRREVAAQRVALLDEAADVVVDRLFEAFEDRYGDDDEAADDEGDEDNGGKSGKGKAGKRPTIRRVRLAVPEIWNEEDEPDLVEYVDADSGKVAIREGRKRGIPSAYDYQPA